MKNKLIYEFDARGFWGRLFHAIGQTILVLFVGILINYLTQSAFNPENAIVNLESSEFILMLVIVSYIISGVISFAYFFMNTKYSFHLKNGSLVKKKNKGPFEKKTEIPLNNLVRLSITNTRVGRRHTSSSLYAELDTGEKPYEKVLLFKSGSKKKVRKLENILAEEFQMVRT